MADPLVLVIDDTRDERIIARTLLRRYGYRVLTARTAQRGMRLAARVHPDVIVLDLMMPGMDGVTALRALRSDPRTATIPVLLYTAYADVFWRQLAGLDHVHILEKPISGMSFVDAIRGILGQERRQPTAA